MAGQHGNEVIGKYNPEESAMVLIDRKELAELRKLREPSPGLLCGDVAISTNPSFAGWVFVRYIDGINWTTGAKLTPETWGMLAAAIDAERKEGA